jgi:hypothetical protein
MHGFKNLSIPNDKVFYNPTGTCEETNLSKAAPQHL